MVRRFGSFTLRQLLKKFDPAVRVQSFIYDMVTLGSSDTKLFLRTMDAVPPGFLANYVKRLCLSVSVDASDAERILGVCTGVVDLAFWVDYLRVFPAKPISPFIAPLPLQRLSIELNHFTSLFSDLNSQPKWADTLTHLDIVLWAAQTSNTIPHLDRLAALTHLALRPLHNIKNFDFSITLSSCKRLQVLILYDEPDSDEGISSEDPRVVYMPYPFKIIPEWEAQARNEDECSWSRADELVRKNGAEREPQGLSAVNHIQEI